MDNQTIQITEQKHHEMLYTSLRIRAGDSSGSGTVLYSKIVNNREAETYILTNHHVIDDLIVIADSWDSLLGRNVKKEKRSVARAEIFQYNHLSRNIGRTGLDADIVAYDEKLDLALLKLRDVNPVKYVAYFIPQDKIREIHIFDEICAVGAQLGVPPIPTYGQVVHMDSEIENERFNMGTYNSIYGSSGGAVFRYAPDRGHYEFVGVPARVQVLPQIFSVDTITHLSYFIPIESVLLFLKEWCYEFISDPTADVAECHKRRDLKKTDARKSLERMYGVVEPDAENGSGKVPK